MSLKPGVFSNVAIVSAGEALSVRSMKGNGGDGIVIRVNPPVMDVINNLVITGVLTLNGSILGAAFQTGNINEATTIMSSNSGTWYSVDQTTGYTITLPTPVNGTSYKFFLTTAGAGDVVVLHSTLGGTITSPDAGLSVDIANTSLTFVGGVSVVGDSIELYAIEGKWTFVAVTGAVGGIVGGI
jgi:hypothetical protein